MARRKAKWQNDYISRTYDRINLLVRRGDKQLIQDAAAAAGESVTAYIIGAISARMISEGLDGIGAHSSDDKQSESENDA